MFGGDLSPNVSINDTICTSVLAIANNNVSIVYARSGYQLHHSRKGRLCREIGKGLSCGVPLFYGAMQSIPRFAYLVITTRLTTSGLTYSNRPEDSHYQNYPDQRVSFCHVLPATIFVILFFIRVSRSISDLLSRGSILLRLISASLLLIEDNFFCCAL